MTSNIYRPSSRLRNPDRHGSDQPVVGDPVTGRFHGILLCERWNYSHGKQGGNNLDLKGQSAGFSGSSTIAANAHLSVFLNQIPGFQRLPSSFRGVLRVSSSAAFSAIGLRGRYNERGEFLIATTPALAENSAVNIADLVFPRIVSGAGYATEFLLMSRGSNSAGTVLFRSQSGAELQLPLCHIGFCPF